MGGGGRWACVLRYGDEAMLWGEAVWWVGRG